MVKKTILKKSNSITPRELRKDFGNLTTTNTTSNDLIRGANNQWRKFNDTVYQDKEFDQRLVRVFGNQK